MVGMPVPSRIDSSMVMISARNRLLAPSPMIQLPKMVPTPVCVIMPMMVPTMAQAMPTVSADLALSASESRQAASVARPPRVIAAIAISPATTHDDRHDLEPGARDRGHHQRKPDPEDVAQHRVGEAERDAGAEDQRNRQRKAHAAGIERRKAFEQHVDQGRQRQHQIPARTSAFQALGISERFMPTRPCLPASRCTIQNAEAK